MKAAFNDADQVRRARGRAAEYLKDPGVKLEIDKLAVENAFLLEHVFRLLMAQAGCHAITIAGCMAPVMPIAQTSACLALSTLNDAGYLAFCESDFVVIPAGLLLSHIAGRPHFLNDPTYPHGNVITLAHCTAPRKMDGKSLDPVRIVTHFESDYGAAPKVEFRPGQKVTSIIPDFAQARWIGLLGEIVGVPFLPICRAQMDISYKVSDRKLIENMPGFHWETIYGDYLREVGYALKKTPIKWEPLG
jgi:L-fucose isomerase-like protein